MNSNPRFSFPGDVDLSPQEQAIVWQLTDWRGAVDIVFTGAKALGLPLSPATYERMQRVCAYCLYFDRLLDNSGLPNAHDIFEAIVDGRISREDELPNEIKDRSIIMLLRSVEPALAAINHGSNIRACVKQLASYAQAKARAKDIASYSRVLTEEGHLSARLIVECVSNEEKQHPAHDAFQRWLASLITSATLLDSIVDLRPDHELGRISIQPLLRHRLGLLPSWWREARQTLRYPQPTIAVLLLSARREGPRFARIGAKAFLRMLRNSFR